MIYHLIRDGEIVASRDFAEGEDVPTLAPNKGAWLPEVVEGEAFDPVSEVREGPETTIEAERVLVAYTVRGKTPDEVAVMRAACAARIKAEAGRRILAVYPDWKQRNMTMQGVDLVYIHLQRPWTPEEAAAAAALQAAKAWIDGIRTRSDELEASIPADPAGIAAFDPLAGWAA